MNKNNHIAEFSEFITNVNYKNLNDYNLSKVTFNNVDHILGSNEHLYKSLLYNLYYNKDDFENFIFENFESESFYKVLSNITSIIEYNDTDVINKNTMITYLYHIKLKYLFDKLDMNDMNNKDVNNIICTGQSIMKNILGYSDQGTYTFFLIIKDIKKLLKLTNG